MPDDKVDSAIAELVRKQDLMNFLLHPHDMVFTRKIIPGETKGKYPEDTIVTIVNYHSKYVLRIFPSLEKGKGRRKKSLDDLEPMINVEELKRLYPGKIGRIEIDPFESP